MKVRAYINGGRRHRLPIFARILKTRGARIDESRKLLDRLAAKSGAIHP
ncbi:hypothetical protein X739_11235 [Mesorhizobium sp. LNHC220B00]|nr:hypothetical protein X739_11235 [Mesorhizobium sp. LNHC220B00]